ncbi:hypothetical protein VNI00_005446 [Paramarasmius palmivorus]|uniref:Carboxylic ester hydrolase n=1 Tax=Paramarasmius palmivorus TaxID=297713 RepID=A0AAW0DE69_9AGAR
MKILFAFLSLLVSQRQCLANPTQQGPIIDLGYARYQGVFNPTTNVTDFIGVRFAAPPTGQLRWQAPQPPTPTPGVQIANVQIPQCIQAPSFGILPTSAPIPSSSHSKRQTPTAASEDCLFLHRLVSDSDQAYLQCAFSGKYRTEEKVACGRVDPWWRANEDANRYILGDAIGFNGADLIKESNNGVVAVFIQYRLGLFGFLAGEKVKQGGVLNAGLCELSNMLFMALFVLIAFSSGPELCTSLGTRTRAFGPPLSPIPRLIIEQISEFGGDPAQVTIWGESAGAGSVLQHVIAEDGRTKPQLFRGAMTSSTFLPSQYKFNDPVPESLYKQVVSATNCTSSRDTLACLRSKDISVLDKANQDINKNGFFGTFVFVPVVDGTFITQRATEALKKGRINGKALLAVTNTDEGSPFVNQTAPADATRYTASLFPRLGPKEVATVAKLYADVGSPLAQVNQIMTDSIFVCPTYYLLDAFKNRSFKGEFAIPPASHGQDVAYYFPTLGAPISFNNTAFLNAFAQSFMSFVISQDPNAKVDFTNITPRWRLYNQGQAEMMFNKTANNLPDVREVKTSQELVERCRFWESVGSLTGQ